MEAKTDAVTTEIVALGRQVHDAKSDAAAWERACKQARRERDSLREAVVAALGCATGNCGHKRDSDCLRGIEKVLGAAVEKAEAA